MHLFDCMPCSTTDCSTSVCSHSLCTHSCCLSLRTILRLLPPPANQQLIPCLCREFEDDVPLLKNVAVGIMSELGVAHCGLVDDLVHEMVRCGGGELHAVAAVMAGMAAQEAIKLLTFQFVPMSGALIYNAMSATSSVFRF